MRSTDCTGPRCMAASATYPVSTPRLQRPVPHHARLRSHTQPRLVRTPDQPRPLPSFQKTAFHGQRIASSPPTTFGKTLRYRSCVPPASGALSQLLYARCSASLAPGLRVFAVISFPSFGASLHRSLLSCGARCSPAPSCPISDPQTTANSGTACRNGAQRIGSPV
jgi:hypothetical protein